MSVILRPVTEGLDLTGGLSGHLAGPSLVIEGAMLAALAAWGWTQWLPQLRTPETTIVLVVVAAALAFSFLADRRR
jgi:hypothetical protein